MNDLDLISTTLDEVDPNGAALLDDVAAYIARHVAFPTPHALTAVTLWVAHTHCLDYFESSPRLAFLSPEPASGKTRALEIIEALVPHPMNAINATPAALFRSVSDLEHRPTILFDEVDSVFGPKAKEHEELRGLLNAGHRRSGKAYRCVGEGTRQRVVPFPAFAALAMAGLGDLPDTLMSRSVIVRMRRRGPTERITPFRQRIHEPEGHALRDRISYWTGVAKGSLDGVWPQLPVGLVDRPADVWEPLIALADAAGGTWPDAARSAALDMSSFVSTDVSLGVRLLADLLTVFGDAEVLRTEKILEALHEIEDAPWSDLYGKPLDARGLARRLRPYGVSSTLARVEGEPPRRGYRREDLWDPWTRYVSDFPSFPRESVTSVTSVLSGGEPGEGRNGSEATATALAATCVTPSTPDEHWRNACNASSGEGKGDPLCQVCGDPMDPTLAAFGERTHPTCLPRDLP